MRIEQPLQRFRRHPGLPQQIEVQGRVEVAAARSHNQAFQRGESHGGIHAPAMFYSRGAGPVAQMEGYGGGFLQGLSQISGRFFGHKMMGGAVEPIAADMKALVEIVGECVVVGLGGKGLVKHGKGCRPGRPYALNRVVPADRRSLTARFTRSAMAPSASDR